MDSPFFVPQQRILVGHLQRRNIFVPDPTEYAPELQPENSLIAALFKSVPDSRLARRVALKQGRLFEFHPCVILPALMPVDLCQHSMQASIRRQSLKTCT